MLRRVRLHGPGGGPEEQGGEAGVPQRAGGLHHRDQGRAAGGRVPGDSQNGGC